MATAKAAHANERHAGSYPPSASIRATKPGTRTSRSMVSRLATFQTLAWLTAAAAIFPPRAVFAPESTPAPEAAPATTAAGGAALARTSAVVPATASDGALGATPEAAPETPPAGPPFAAEGPPAADAGTPVICPPPHYTRASRRATRPPGRHLPYRPPSPR